MAATGDYEAAPKAEERQRRKVLRWRRPATGVAPTAELRQQWATP